jgi:lysine-specific permease
LGTYILLYSNHSINSFLSNDDPHEVFGFKYWNSPGAFSNGALGVVNAFVLASFSMQGTEIVGITAGECENPVKVIK